MHACRRALSFGLRGWPGGAKGSRKGMAWRGQRGQGKRVGMAWRGQRERDGLEGPRNSSPARKELSVLFGHLQQLREHLLLEARLPGVIAR